MKHEHVYYTCDSCDNELSEEGRTEVQAHYTGHVAPTINDTRTWELCAKCWLDVFAILDRQDQRRAEEAAATPFRKYDEDELRPWLDRS